MIKSPILFVLHMPPPIHGAAMVGKYIHESELINSEFDCHYINLATASGLEDIGKFKIKKLLLFWKLLCNIFLAVRKIKPSLVYITPNAKGGPFYKDFIVVIMLKMMGCKIMAHYHNKGVATRQDKWLDDLLYRRFFKGIKVILLGENLYQDIIKYVKREDVYICPNGIPIEITKKKDNDKPRILFLSNLLIDKGIMVLLDALELLKDKGRSFSCDIVGGETIEIDTKRLDEEILKRNMSDIVSYRGKQYGSDKIAYLNKADIFVHPTNDDCFPLVLLEAMQHKLPIITTNEGGIPDIVKDGGNGFICEKRNPKDLAEKILLLLNDQQLRLKMGQDGYQKYKENFTLEAFEKRMLEILQSNVK